MVLIKYLFIRSLTIYMTDHCLYSSFFILVLVILAVYPLKWILESVCSISVKTTLKSWLKLYWTFVKMLGISSSMKMICLHLFRSILFPSITFCHFFLTQALGLFCYFYSKGVYRFCCYSQWEVIFYSIFLLVIDVI